GAVTRFHGLPSDHVRPIAQDADGVLWFGTDAGLAKYDGRTQKVVADGLPSGRIRVLKFDGNGGLWIGTDAGAGRLVGDRFNLITETTSNAITSIITPERGQAIMASEQGLIFTCTSGDNGSVAVKTLGPSNSPLLLNSTGKIPLLLTSLAAMKDTLLVGTHGRGLLSISGNEVKEL